MLETKHDRFHEIESAVTAGDCCCCRRCWSGMKHLWQRTVPSPSPDGCHIGCEGGGGQRSSAVRQPGAAEAAALARTKTHREGDQARCAGRLLARRGPRRRLRRRLGREQALQGLGPAQERVRRDPDRRGLVRADIRLERRLARRLVLLVQRIDEAAPDVVLLADDARVHAGGGGGGEGAGQLAGTTSARARERVRGRTCRAPP